MAPNWPYNRFPGEFGIALRSILKMLRNAVPNSPDDRFYGQLGAALRFIVASLYMVNAKIQPLANSRPLFRLCILSIVVGT
jgi:hypothetical protein